MLSVPFSSACFLAAAALPQCIMKKSPISLSLFASSINACNESNDDFATVVVTC